MLSSFLRDRAILLSIINPIGDGRYNTSDETADYYDDYLTFTPNAFDIFKFYALEGATYRIASISYFDPEDLYLYDSEGNLVAQDITDGNPQFSYGGDGLSYQAETSGYYYIDAGWQQGSATLESRGAAVAVFEDVDTIAPIYEPAPDDGSGNNLIYGTDEDDIIYDNDGWDTIRSGDGDDTIYSKGRNSINAGDGDDVIYARNFDIVFGDAGSDLIIIVEEFNTVESITIFGDQSYDDSIDTVVFDGYFMDYSISDKNEYDFSRNIVNLMSSEDNEVTIIDIERIQFRDATLALDIDRNAGEIYRLYEAAFNRTPDDSGLTFWIGVYDEGNLSLQDIASRFIDSPEFEGLYGNVDSLQNSEFITYLYGNILDRAPEPSGFNYWVEKADEGLSFENILVYFSESAENVAAVGSQISNGIWYDYS